MATITSTATGNWDAGGTWVGGVAPGNGDKAIIATGHVVTIPDGVSVTVGTSGATGTEAITIQGTGKLVIGATTGATLIARGDVLMAQTSTSRTSGFYALTINAGSVFEFDASQATTPLSQTYVCGPTQDSSPNARVLIAGTALARCTVRSNASGGNGRFGLRGFTLRLGSVRATYCDFTRIGTASLPAFDLYLYDLPVEPDEFSLTFCTLTSCGRISQAVFLYGGLIFRLEDTTWTSSLDTCCVYVTTYTYAIGAGVRSVKRCAFDKRFGDPSSGAPCKDFSFEHVLFEDGTSITDGYPLALWDNIVLRKTTTGDTPLPGPTISNTYMLADHATVNPHFIGVSTATDTAFSGLILEYTGSAGDGDGLTFSGSPASLVTHAVENSIVLPDGSGSQSSCTLATALTNSANFRLEATHNTMMGGPGSEHGVQINETQRTPAGFLPVYKSNLYWDTSARANHINTVDTGAIDNAMTPGGATHNCAYNATTASHPGKTSDGTYYDAPTTVTVPGANDVNVDPGFADSTRNFADYATTFGDAATTANTLTRLRVDLATRIPALLTYVRDGFAPTNAALETAGHDGETIGAVAYVAPASGATSVAINSSPIIRGA